MANNLVLIPFKHAKRGEEEIIVNPSHIQYIGPFGDDDYAVYFSSGDIQHVYIARETYDKLKKSLMK